MLQRPIRRAALAVRSRSRLGVVWIALLFSILACGSGSRSKTLPDRQLDEKIGTLLAKIDAYRAEHLKPVNTKAFQRVFPPEEPTSSGTQTARGPDVYDHEASPAKTLPTVTPGAIGRMPQLRQELEAYYGKTQHQWDLVAEAIEGGYFDSDQPPWSVSGFAGDNRLKGYVFLAKGELKKAVDVFAMGLRLGERRVSKQVWQSIHAVSSLRAARSGYVWMLWRGMDPVIARYALDSFRDVRIVPEECLFPGLWAEALKSYRRLLRGEGKPSEWREDHFLLPLSGHRLWRPLEPLALTRPENRRWLARIRRMGKPETALPVFWYGSRTVTTAPALKKRLRHILATEPAFRKEHLLFDETDFEGLPPELEALLRVPCSLGHWQNLTNLVCETATWLELTRVALAARVFRADKGHWPANVAELLAADLISTPPAYFPDDVTIVDLYSKFRETPEIADVYVVKRILGRFPLDLPSEFGTPSWLIHQSDGRTTFAVRYYNKPELRLDIIEQGLRALAPLVQSVRRVDFFPQDYSVNRRNFFPKDYGVPGPRAGEVFGPPPRDPICIEAEFKRPQHFWCVYSRGPDGKDDGDRLDYHPRNEETESDDLVHIVAWE